MEFCAATRFFTKQIELYFENMKVHKADRLYFVRMKPPHELFALRDKVMNGASKIHTRNLSREAHLGELGEARTDPVGLPWREPILLAPCRASRGRHQTPGYQRPREWLFKKVTSDSI